MSSMRCSARRRMWRGSPSYGSPSGVRMSANMRATPPPSSSGRQGSTANVVGSGIAIMSDSSIALKPVIEDPSKPIPPSNASSSSEALMLNDFSWPRMSVNQSRMKRIPRSSASALTSSRVMGESMLGGRVVERPPAWHWTAVQGVRAATDRRPGSGEPAVRPRLELAQRRRKLAPHVRERVLDPGR